MKATYGVRNELNRIQLHTQNGTKWMETRKLPRDRENGERWITKSKEMVLWDEVANELEWDRE